MLKHLGLWKQDAGSRCKEPKPDHGPVAYEEFDDGWCGYEEAEKFSGSSSVSLTGSLKGNRHGVGRLYTNSL
jgi:hypothetical protein